MKIVRIAGLLVLLAVLLLFPNVFTNPEITGIAALTLFYATAASSWNIFSGYTGYIALGHAVFFGVGSYTMAILCKAWGVPGGYEPFLLLPLTGLMAAVFAIPIGWISLRTRRHTFIVITIAIFFIMQLMAFNLRVITNGSAGMELPIPGKWSGSFYNLPFYYVALVMLLAVLGVSWWIRNSKYGLGLLAIRDDEDRALGLGVKTGSSKLIAFVVSAFFVGMVGALHAYFVGSIFPAFVFDPLFDVAIALMCFLGGLGTLGGPLLGALILEPTQQFFTIQFSQNGYYLIIYGFLFLAIILLLPEGILPTLRRYWIGWRGKQQAVKIGSEESETENPKEALLMKNNGKKQGVKL